ncbi:hypothetical protein [Rickettsia endosymbiont of Polydrusus tereticollis]|uniref:hypothetical protein n=1 Tax=Rickettsia endosymbiont of Polydrusus tereticollis TaxID=3066251 RepID=UPI003132CD17
MAQTCILKPDAKGRITLGKLAKGISSFHLTVNNKKGQIILEPYAEIPLRESWLFNNKTALIQLNKGIENSAKGQTVSRGDFNKYLNDE